MSNPNTQDLTSKQVEPKINDNLKKEENVLIDPVKYAEYMRNKMPNGEKQYQAIKEFSKGKLSYAEMRELCG